VLATDFTVHKLRIVTTSSPSSTSSPHLHDGMAITGDARTGLLSFWFRVSQGESLGVFWRAPVCPIAKVTVGIGFLYLLRDKSLIYCRIQNRWIVTTRLQLMLLIALPNVANSSRSWCQFNFCYCFALGGIMQRLLVLFRILTFTVDSVRYFTRSQTYNR